ncbi:MAG: alginate lyase family protein [Bacteroidota bacterium]
MDARERVKANDPVWVRSAGYVRAKADQALGIRPVSVMDDEYIAPSGDKHDFLCPAPLWWPDADQENGLPYFWNREGEINPEYYEIGDQVAFERMATALQNLALGYYLFGEEKYAEHASLLLRTWFLDPPTRMNPNLNHAWFERGRNEGTSFGIKSMEKLPYVIDAVGLLASSDVWTNSDQADMTEWVAAYLEWLTDSDMGRDAKMIWNRFGTVYDVQVVTCALFLNQELLARRVVEASKDERIKRHIRRDGRQPYELEREITFSNSVESVGYLFQLATMAERLGIDLWNHTAVGGGSIRKALDFVAPYADSTRVWPYILEVRPPLLVPLLLQGSVAYDDDEYGRLLRRLPREDVPVHTSYVLYSPWHKQQQDTLSTSMFVLKKDILVGAKGAIAGGDTSYDLAMRILRKEAEQALSVRAASVMEKALTPPSGDKHDFMSIGGYYWPDPTKPDGMPWIYRDGKVNPDRVRYGDHIKFAKMAGAVWKLGLAYHMTGEEEYARHATSLLRVWFLDPATRMKPNLRYSHAQPGVFEGSYYGIIHLGIMPLFIDCLGMLVPSSSWTEKDHSRMVDWFVQFLDWMLNDEDAQEARRVWNNHGTNYDQAAVSFALFAGRRGLARRILEECTKERVDRQIRPDGRLPYELERNRAIGYTAATVAKFLDLATMGEILGVDLWNYASPDGSSIQRAIDFLAPYADPAAEWPFTDYDVQRYGVKPFSRLRSLLQRASLAYDDQRYGALAEMTPIDEDLLKNQDLPFLFYPYAAKGL